MKNKHNQSGFALITMLVFMVIGITVISAAAMVVTTSILAGSNSELGMKAYYVAESGAQDAMLRLLRNPNLVTITPYTMTTDDGTATITITNSTSGGTITDTITSIGTIVTTTGTTTKKIQVITNYTNGQYTTASWNEIP
jgi:hypothetical protein